jgi:predicted HTH domain antitoxin
MQYKAGKLSLGKTAEELHTPLSELIDLLAEFGIKSPLSYEDYLEGLKHMSLE